jgi:argininosuccinate lyase
MEKERKRILEKLQDLTEKIESNESLPDEEQDIHFLLSMEDRIDEILNAWYY